MEQQYDYSSLKQKNQDSPRRKVWRTWKPLFIKLGITYLVAVIFSAVIMGNYFMEEVGMDQSAIESFMSNEENVQTIYVEVMERAMDYSIYADALAAIITIPILLYMFKKDKIKHQMEGVVQKQRAPLTQYVWIVLISVAMCVALNNLIFISDLSSYSESYQQTMDALYSASLGVQILTLGILTPFCEELVFRGLMFNRVKQYGGYRSAMFFTTFVFAIMHMNLVQILYAAIMGLLFAYLYEKYGSFKAPLCAHIAANIASIAGTHFKVFDWLLQDFVRIAAVTVVCAALAATAYVFIQRIEDLPEQNEPVAE